MIISVKNVLIFFLSVLLFISFAADAGFSSGKSSYKSFSSSYRSSYKSYSTPSRSSGAFGSYSSSSASKSPAPATSPAKPSAPSTSSVSKQNSVPGSKTIPRTSVSGSSLVAKKGLIPAQNKATADSGSGQKSSTRIPAQGYADYSRLSKAAPSDNVRTLIKEKQGTDWTTLALMSWMLSSNNSHASSLSSDDRTWIKQQISYAENNDSAGTETGLDGGPDNDTKANKPEFSLDIPEHMKAGKLWMFTVNAVRDGKTEVPVCKLANAEFKNMGNLLFVKWKSPDTPGTTSEISCEAFGAHYSQRLKLE